jgi:anti-anti-sigma regulatory factor
MPEVLGLNSSTALARTVPSRLMDEPIWRSPPRFGSAAANELQLAVANVTPPWFLDWSPIEVIAPDAVEPLGKLFGEWSSTPVELRFRGCEELERALRVCTPSGDKSIEPSQWRLRMDALRIMQMQDEFDLVALDYCVTYEVSPPSWQDARCHFIRDTVPAPDAQSGDSTMSAAGQLPADPGTPDNQGLTVTTGFESGPAAVVELSGEILGEATAALARLEEARQGADRLVVSCANLIRVDFSAAGGILNWVATRQAEGCHLQFRDVHRLVAAFFNVIGINEHSRVVLRTT